MRSVMMSSARSVFTVGGRLAAATLGGALALGCAGRTADEPKEVSVQLCDGETTLALARKPETRSEGQAAAEAMMASWRTKNPARDWEADVRSRHWIAPVHDNAHVLDAGQGTGHPGRAFNARDLLVWQRETEALVAEGARVFHSGDELGSTIAVSCDMCHPDAANTHPETYPKYQTQIGKSVLLRDMINWCLQHPVRAEPMAEDDARMRALEAYIYAQRTGTPLAYGKH
jgi:thiosulfate dehydrogenase